jgi:hypothetical protein
MFVSETVAFCHSYTDVLAFSVNLTRGRYTAVDRNARARSLVIKVIGTALKIWVTLLTVSTADAKCDLALNRPIGHPIFKAR